MGYQDGMGLRPGRTRDKLSADRGNSSSTFNAASGYRATGAVSPIREAEKTAADPNATGTSALSQFSAGGQGMQVPKAPGLLQTVGSSVAMKAGEKALDKATGGIAGRYVDHAMSGSSIPFQSLEDANATADPIYTLGNSEGWWSGVPDSAKVATEPMFFDDAGVGSDLAPGSWLGDFADEGASAADAAGSATELYGGADAAGGSFPGLSIASNLAKGNYAGAGLTAAGYAIGGPVGGFVGSLVGNVFGGGGCFITEATMAGLGVQDDNAEPLKVLRFFRDQVLSKTPQGQAMIQEYEDIAPLVVEAIESRPDAMEIFKKIYTDFIAPAVEAIKAQNFPQALQIYAAMIAAVTPLAQEAMDAEDAMEGEMQQAGEPQEGPQEAMQQMGQHAGMVAQNPRVAQQAAPQGALSQFNAEEEDYPSSVRFGRQ